MSITSRINEMSSHIEQAYDELQGLGADLTNVNKNIENISMVLDDIYDSMPQVSGEGTSLTLDDTRVGKIKSTLKGNTSQDGTPTPTSPIPVNVVSGDNTITISNQGGTDSNTYNIDLPVENLWGGFSNSLSRTDSGVQFTANQDGTITASGTATNVATSIILSEATSNGIYKTLQKGTYTVSGGGAKYSVEVYDKNNVVKLGGIPVNGSSVSFTINSETQVVLRIQVANGITINETIKLQIEKSSKANSYTPYGTTPIELCKIGNYQDYFGKSDGRNLFDKSTITTSAYLKEDGTLQTGTGAEYITSDFIPVKPNTTYYKTQTLSPRTKFYDKNKQVLDSSTYQDISIGGNAGSFTTPNNAYYFRFTGNVNTSTGININTTMVNEGSSALPYQPYGVGKWYLHKEIGKVVLNGSESDWSYPSANRFNLDNVIDNYLKRQDYITYSSNYYEAFKQSIDNSVFNTLTTNTNYGFNLSSTTSNFYVIRFKDTRYTSIADFKNWLASNNVSVYYVLATPTNEEITYQPLIGQLNLLEKAMSKDGQTNISQVNNDLPFIISASALKEWQENTSLNSTLSMVNPLSLGNTLNTQENDIQPIEVDNIEPLEEEENEES